MAKKMLVLPGDGIGPAIVAQVMKVVRVLRDHHGLELDCEEALIGGAAIDATGEPLPASTLAAAKAADLVLLGAVGGPQWEPLPMRVRPEKGLLGIRSGLGLFANLRPAILYPQLAAASTLKPEVVAGLDIMIVRELVGGIYFGEPRGVRVLDNGERQGYNTEVYRESEIRRIARVAFELAIRRGRRLCSIDKANVLEATELWREVVTEVARDYPQVAVSHMYVDNCAMQLVRNPRQFDVVVTNNMFGDILSDLASMLTGSIGMLPSASLDANGKGMYEPIHGSAPDIAGRDVANPIATVLSLAMALRYTLDRPALAEKVEAAVGRVLDRGLRTPDIMAAGATPVGTEAMGDAIAALV
jgi:3-isopropylmalate dehydrogenase